VICHCSFQQQITNQSPMIINVRGADTFIK
jgi:hypothetical protein